VQFEILSDSLLCALGESWVYFAVKAFNRKDRKEKAQGREGRGNRDSEAAPLPAIPGTVYFL
jgi:hypothetical protein